MNYLKKSSSKKISTICDECKEITREADALYDTTSKPQRRLCRACFSEWIGVDLTGVRL